MIKSLTEEQYAVFMSKLAEAHVRDQCIMLFMLQGGLRNGEVCNLQWSDVCVIQEVFHTIRVVNGHSRKKKIRYVTLAGKLRETIVEYQKWYDKRYSYRDPYRHMFITHNQKINIQQRDIQRLVGKYTIKWLQVAFTPHSLRHTFATRLLRCSNTRIVQQLLGHESLSSTEIYTHPSSDDRNNAINQAF